MPWSRWMAPPPPEDDVDEMYDDHPNSEIGEGDSRSIDSPSQHSQPTESGISRQDTRTVRPKKRTKKPLLNFSDTHSSAGSIELDRDEQWSVGLAVAMALAIAVPVSMLLGAALTFLLLRLLG